MEHLSYSSISSYLSCPANFKFKYIDKAPTWSTPELAFGSAFHGTLEEHLKGNGSVLDLWPAQWQKCSTDESRSQILWGMDKPEHYHNEGIRMFSHQAIIDGLQVIHAQYDGGAIEREVNLRVPGVPVPVLGFIDVTLKGGIPADFKTSSKAWNQERAQGELQSLFYLAALSQIGETVPGWMFKHIVFVKTKTPQFQIFEHSHKPGEIFWLCGMIQKVWKGIEAGIFPENPGSWKCGPVYCDFWKLCRGKFV